MTTGATLHVAVRPREVGAGAVRVKAAGPWPLAAPCGFLIAGAVIGYAFSLDRSVALERLVGLVAASMLSIVATSGLRRIERPSGLLLGVSLAALATGVWVVAASGPEIFRGALGSILDAILRPVFSLVHLSDPVEVTNTRFIVGYNGLIDLCLAAVFACGAGLLERPRTWMAAVLSVVLVVSLVLLVGAGARGGLTGLAAGLCAAAVFAWPRRYALLALVGAPAALAIAAVGILDKGLEFSSTAGRLTYWMDLGRLLIEYPLTGVGLGVDTANRVARQYEINPDPERVFYAHNTFVQSYLEQGPLGAIGMLALPVVVLGAALLARKYGAVRERRPLLIAGLGVVGAMEAHGLTDQVVTTNVGTGMLLLASAAAFASLTDEALARLGRWTLRGSVAIVGLCILGCLALVVTPGGRAQTLLDIGGLKMNQAFALPSQSPARAAVLAEAEAVLSQALGQDSSHPAVLRDLASVRAARFDDRGGLAALQQAAASPHIDAFDMLQVAHVYRDLGAVDEAYAWAARAYAIWGRSPEDAVMQMYAQSTLTDTRARTLATQAEAAMLARHFSDAHSLFQQALTFEPASAYVQDRIGASQRAVDKYGG